MTNVIEGKARKPWPCNHNGCKKKIAKGQAYYLWHLGGEALRQHQDHGQPVAKPATKKTTKAAKKVTRKNVSKKKGGKK